MAPRRPCLPVSSPSLGYAQRASRTPQKIERPRSADQRTILRSSKEALQVSVAICLTRTPESVSVTACSPLRVLVLSTSVSSLAVNASNAFPSISLFMCGDSSAQKVSEKPEVTRMPRARP